MARDTWEPGPARPTLDADAVHVWRAPLDVPPPELAALEAALSPDERARAARYRFPRDRRRFVAARGALRRLVASYAGVEPAGVRFGTEPGGKPALADPATAWLRFNVSHAGELALVAMARGRAVGVDVEVVRTDLADLEVADRFFSPAEAAAIRALPPPERAEAFLSCWTRKEAFVKALGAGLREPLDGFTVPLGADEPLILRRAPDARPLTGWSLVALRPAPGYVGALVVEGRAPAVRRFTA